MNLIILKESRRVQLYFVAKFQTVLSKIEHSEILRAMISLECFCFFLFLLGACCADADNSGDCIDSDCDPVNDTAICFNPYGHETDNTTTIAFTSITEAHLYGRCLSTCLDEVHVSLTSTVLSMFSML